MRWRTEGKGLEDEVGAPGVESDRRRPWREKCEAESSVGTGHGRKRTSVQTDGQISPRIPGESPWTDERKFDQPTEAGWPVSDDQVAPFSSSCDLPRIRSAVFCA